MEFAEDTGVPDDIIECAKEVSLTLLPPKSREIYESVYERFLEWCKEKAVHTYSEDVLMVYFSNLAKKMKPSTLWSQYSMLRSTLDLKKGVNISKYSKLRAFLKRQNEGYRPKKARVFTKEQVDGFLNTAPDNLYLLMKVLNIL